MNSKVIGYWIVVLISIAGFSLISKLFIEDIDPIVALGVVVTVVGAAVVAALSYKEK